MGLIFRRRVQLDENTHANISTNGVSVSRKIGPRVTVNSRGRITIRLGRGISWRIK